MDEDTEKDAS